MFLEQQIRRLRLLGTLMHYFRFAPLAINWPDAKYPITARLPARPAGEPSRQLEPSFDGLFDCEPANCSLILWPSSSPLLRERSGQWRARWQRVSEVSWTPGLRPKWSGTWPPLQTACHTKPSLAPQSAGVAAYLSPLQQRCVVWSDRGA